MPQGTPACCPYPDYAGSRTLATDAWKRLQEPVLHPEGLTVPGED
jgi:hypothetical protein